MMLPNATEHPFADPGWVFEAIAFGIVLQAVEVATALIMGLPALLNEGLSWREVRLRTMHATPVRLPALPKSAGVRAGAGLD